MTKPKKPLPLHKRELVSNGSSLAPAWVADAVSIGSANLIRSTRRCSSALNYKLLCGSGVLVQGSSPDLLVCLLAAREARTTWKSLLPQSTFRIHIFYPNRQRVCSSDMAAASRALDDKAVAASVARRRAAGATNTPARSDARTAVFVAPVGRGLAVAVDVDFCQAGVVAPPDSPDLGNRVSAVDIGCQD